MKRRIFDQEHEMFRDSVKKFLQAEVAPHTERWREQGIVDREAWLKAGEQGLLLLWADEKYGGAGVNDIRYDQVLSEEWAKWGDPGFAVSLHNRVVGPYINGLGTEERIPVRACSHRGDTTAALGHPTAGVRLDRSHSTGGAGLRRRHGRLRRLHDPGTRARRRRRLGQDVRQGPSYGGNVRRAMSAGRWASEVF